jgi:hypothetical protein
MAHHELRNGGSVQRLHYFLYLVNIAPIANILSRQGLERHKDKEEIVSRRVVGKALKEKI